MVYYKDEILKNLEVGERYTGKQICIFMLENRGSLVLSKSCTNFSVNQASHFEVLEYFEAYEHKSTSPGQYNMPNGQKRYYIVE